jgi:hypothetical protein
MKVSIADFKNALTMFEAKIVESQASTMNKFALGVALARLNGGTDKMLAPFTDANGMVDVDRLRADVDAGMKASGGELDITPQFDNALRMLGLSIKNIKFTKEDFAEFFNHTLPSVSPSAIQ